MQMRKTYQGISPQLLYDGIRDLDFLFGCYEVKAGA